VVFILDLTGLGCASARPVVTARSGFARFLSLQNIYISVKSACRACLDRQRLAFERASLQ